MIKFIRFLKLKMIRIETFKIIKEKKYQINRFNQQDRSSAKMAMVRAIYILEKIDKRNLEKGIKPLTRQEIDRLDLIQSLEDGTYKVDTRELCNMTASLANQKKWGDSLAKIARDSGLLK